MLSEQLFVYGTLMLKYPDNPLRLLLENHVTESRGAYVYGTLIDLGDYPALVKGNSKVYGELLVVNSSPEFWSVLDEYEDYDPFNENISLYVRRKMKVFVDKQTSLNSWTYIYNQKTNQFKSIFSGRFY